MTNEQHNKYLGYSFLAYAGFQTFWMLAMLLMMFLFFRAVPTRPGQPAPPAEFFAFVFAMFSVFYLVFTIPSMVAGYGLLKHKPWARLWGIIAGVLAAMSFPVGTAVCVYAMWFLLGNGRDYYAKTEMKQNPAELVSGSDTSYWTEHQERKEKIPRSNPPDWR